MGYNTTLVIMNDALHQIKEDKDFGRKVYEAALVIDRQENRQRGVDISSGCHCNAATVIEQHHADSTAVIAVGGNCATVLHTTYGYRHHEEADQIHILEELADRYGYTIRKKPTKDNKCISCSGSGHYDSNGSPPCGSCNGTGKRSS